MDDNRREPPKKKEPFQLDIRFDDDFAEPNLLADEPPLSKGEVYFSNPPRAPKSGTPPRTQTPRRAPAKKAGPAPRRKKKARGGWAIALTLVCALGISVALSYVGITALQDIFAMGKAETEEVTIDIPGGQTTDQVIDLLANQGLIKQRTLCKLYTRFTFMIKHKHETDPKPPEYLAGSSPVSGSMGLEEMLYSFQEEAKGRETVNVSFPEGITVNEVVTKLGTKGVTGADALHRTLQLINFEDYPFLKALQENPDARLRYNVFEGYLYPDTYNFYKNDNAASTLRRFLDNFQAKWTPEYDARAKSLKMSVDDVIILASIIQKEAGGKGDALKKQMADISGVLHNRLNKSSVYQTLDCNSTKDYVINTVQVGGMQQTDKDVFLNRYDTYFRLLPAGPVCNPGGDAIRAALYPSEHEYYYFLHDKFHNIYLNKTLAAHSEKRFELIRKGELL
ncbi:MAG: endolytic transglycosylase MltG [Oscillospiraceae bacterium]|jgi:UPF0755 protein|nr:endolytic transglycosylase MltG [Oscillospiraceae bacterium]